MSHSHSVIRSVARRKVDRIIKKAEMFNSCFVPSFSKEVNGNHADIIINVSNKGMRSQVRIGKEKEGKRVDQARLFT